MKIKYNLLILCIFLISLVVSCSNSSNIEDDFGSFENNNKENVQKVIKSIKGTTVKNKNTICVSSITLNEQSTKRSTAPSYTAHVENTISYIDNNVLHPFIFTNKKGDNFILTTITGVRLSKITNNLVAFDFDKIYKLINVDEEKNIYNVSSPLYIYDNISSLLNAKTGTFYDVSQFIMFNAIADDSNIYTRDDEKNIYKIDIKTLKPTPFNIGTEYSSHDGCLSVINKDLLLFKGSFFRDSYIIYINENLPPKKIDFENVTGLNNEYKINVEGMDTTLKFRPIIMKGNDGQLYFCATDYKNILTGKIAFDTTSSELVKIIISDTKETPIPITPSRSYNGCSMVFTIYSNECTNCSGNFVLDVPQYISPEYPLRFGDCIFNQDKLVLASLHGYVIKLYIENNELKVSFHNDLNNLRDGPTVYQNDVFYYIDLNDVSIPTIYKYDLKTNEETNLYTDKDLINRLSITKDELIFHKYLSRTEVGIYSYNLATNQMKQIVNNNTEIDCILKMNF